MYDNETRVRPVSNSFVVAFSPMYDSTVSSVVLAAARVGSALVLGLTAMLYASHSHGRQYFGRPWTIVRSPQPTGAQVRFTGVSALTSKDVWAVATTGMGNLIEHWNGATWKVVHGPKTKGVLEAVKAIGHNDVWFVGRANDAPLMEHWNGHGIRVVSGPIPNGGLFGVSALGRSDVVAVGGVDEDSPGVVEKWDGSDWSKFKLSGEESFLDTALVSKSDRWAVGETFGGSGETSADVAHWDGFMWKDWGSVGLAAGSSALYSVTALSAHNVWAVGSATNGYPALVHWNGKMWTVGKGVPIRGGLNGVAAIKWHNVVAVGGSNSGHTLVELWKGRRWRLWRTPKAGPQAYLAAVSIAPDGEVWAVGAAGGTNHVHTLIEHSQLHP